MAASTSESLFIDFNTNFDNLFEIFELNSDLFEDFINNEEFDLSSFSLFSTPSLEQPSKNVNFGLQIHEILG